MQATFNKIGKRYFIYVTTESGYVFDITSTTNRSHAEGICKALEQKATIENINRAYTTG